jgi:hypothetical protein
LFKVEFVFSEFSRLTVDEQNLLLARNQPLFLQLQIATLAQDLPARNRFYETLPSAEKNYAKFLSSIFDIQTQ